MMTLAPPERAAPRACGDGPEGEEGPKTRFRAVCAIGDRCSMLIKYFDNNKLKIMIDYITVMPGKDDGHNRGQKYLFITGKIFNCEVNQILDKLSKATVKVKEIKAEDKDDDGDDKEKCSGKDGKDSDDDK